jgi:transcription antitermination factor NusG
MTHWYALHAKPHKERQVSKFLESEGFEVYLPLLPAARRTRRKALPFFSCYLFARLNGALDFSTVQWTPGLRTVVHFGGKPAIVPDEVVSAIKKRLDWLHESGQTTYPFKSGDRIIVRNGPLADLEGVFEERLSSRDRARILVECLGRWTRCEVEVDTLKRLY